MNETPEDTKTNDELIVDEENFKDEVVVAEAPEDEDEEIPDEDPVDDVGPGDTTDAAKKKKDPPQRVEFQTQLQAFKHFATSQEDTTTQRHIKPVHWYIACRLVLEGGFRPQEIRPRPPFRCEKRGKHNILFYDPTAATHSELTVIGGIKTKNVDVVVVKEDIGPTVAVSCKGITGALRNLTNRLEETIGECNNMHLGYSGLVFGYMFLVHANKQQSEEAALVNDEEAKGRILAANDLAFDKQNNPTGSLIRFRNAMETMNRRGARSDDDGKYESIGFGLVDMNDEPGTLLEGFPLEESTVNLKHFFTTLYTRYDERYYIAAPTRAPVTRRLTWAEDSPAFAFGEGGGMPNPPGYLISLGDPHRKPRKPRKARAKRQETTQDDLIAPPQLFPGAEVPDESVSEKPSET